MADLKGLAEAVINGQRDKAKELTQQAVAAGIPLQQIIDEGLIAGMNVVGVRFKNNEFYVPEVLIAARAMHTAMEVLKPLMAGGDVQPVGRAVIGTVKGDLHDIGKNLVAIMLEGAGFEVRDLGIDVPAEKFIQTAKENGSQLVCLSALLTTTMPAMKEVITSLRNSGLNAKIMIGGAPVTQSYAQEIGADGYAPDAASAVDKAKELIAAA